MHAGRSHLPGPDFGARTGQPTGLMATTWSTSSGPVAESTAMPMAHPSGGGSPATATSPPMLTSAPDPNCLGDTSRGTIGEKGLGRGPKVEANALGNPRRAPWWSRWRCLNRDGTEISQAQRTRLDLSKSGRSRVPRRQGQPSGRRALSSFPRPSRRRRVPRREAEKPRRCAHAGLEVGKL